MQVKRYQVTLLKDLWTYSLLHDNAGICLDLQKLIQLKAKLIKKETAFLYVLYLFNVKLEFIYSEKAKNFCEIFPLLLTAVHTVKSKGKIY